MIGTIYLQYKPPSDHMLFIREGKSVVLWLTVQRDVECGEVFMNVGLEKKRDLV